jgi:hypothetical protein
VVASESDGLCIALRPNSLTMSGILVFTLPLVITLLVAV